ncbi:MAG: hypothetical protein WAT67_09515 [Candidatus Contendobacter sp.]
MATRSIEVELLNETYPLEVNHSMENGVPIIYGVEIMKQTCKKGEVWYDENGNPHFEAHWVKKDILDLLSKQQIRSIALELLEQEMQAVDEDLADRAADLYQDYRECGYFRRFEPAEFSGALA